MINIKRYESVEIQIPSGTSLTRFYYPDLPNLRNAKVTAIEVYTSGAMSATPLTGSTPLSSADLKKATLTLYNGDLQLVYNIPLFNFVSIVDGTNPYVFQLPSIDGINITWVKSYVNFSSAPTGATAISFGVFYNF